MKIDINKLTKYDLSNAKVGDKVIIASPYDITRWYFEEATVKSISPKRGDITFTDRGGTRVDKYGRRIGSGRWDIKYFTYLEHTSENLGVINSYIGVMNESREIITYLRKIERQGFKMLYDLPEDKISVLHKTLAEIFGVKND